MDSIKSYISGKDSYVGRMISGIRYVYNDINPATLTGAIDVIVIEQKDGSFTCGPFHVRFGKMGALRPADKIIDIYLNGVFVPDLQMKLGSAGEAFFIEEVNEGECINDDERLTYTPLPSTSKANDSFRSVEDSQLMRTRSLETFEDIITVPRRKIRVRSGSTDFVVCSEGEEEEESKSFSLDKNYHNDDYAIECLSDTEDVSHTTDDQRLLAYKSDSALNQSHVKEDEALNITWDWGNFPESIVTPNGKSKDDSSLKDYRNKSVSESDKLESAKEKTVDPSKGIYLEDLVTENVDKDVKRNYIYVPQRSLGSNDYHKASSLDGLSSDGGYRSDGENSGSYSPPYPVVHDLKLSICGGLNSEDSISMDHFIQHLVSYEDFLKTPDTILQDPNLVLLLNGKFYPWAVCGPMIVSMLSFQTQLPHQSLKRLQDHYLPKKKAKAKSWFPFGRQHTSNNQNSDKIEETKLSSLPEPIKDETERLKESNPELKSNGSEEKVKTKTYRKKIRLSSDEIKRLNLKKGSNRVEYKMTTKFQGTTSCVAHIFRWHWSDLIVVSDVDGTITKSDVMGQLLPMIGRDWTQAGVARLYNKIASNEYRFVYLSARAIGQSSLTKRFLSDVVQEGSIKLPDGPVLLSPNSLLHAFHQEVIVKNPEEFKIQCMNDIKSLFPSYVNPLFGGFGNKPNDVKAYREVGIPDRRNFIVNPQGTVRNQLSQTYSTNYGEFSSLVDYFFPYYGKYTERVQHDIFNDTSFWRDPLPDIDLP